jgi:hypothetical protein
MNITPTSSKNETTAHLVNIEAAAASTDTMT